MLLTFSKVARLGADPAPHALEIGTIRTDPSSSRGSSGQSSGGSLGGASAELGTSNLADSSRSLGDLLRDRRRILDRLPHRSAASKGLVPMILQRGPPASSRNQQVRTEPIFRVTNVTSGQLECAFSKPNDEQVAEPTGEKWEILSSCRDQELEWPRSPVRLLG